MQIENFIDYYAALGLPFNASKELIEKHYKQALLNVAENIADKQQSLIELAYVILMNDDKRKPYDDSYIKMQMLDTNEDDQLFSIPAHIEGNPDGIFDITKERYAELDRFVTVHLTNQTASLNTKNQAADKAEELYKRGMWPLLGKLKALVGETSVIYMTACELHSKAVFSLGDICVWAERYERAIGMYNTALALSSNNYELALRCAKAIEAAQIAYEENRVSLVKAPSSILNDQEKIYLPYFSILGFLMLGFFFTMLCFWCVLILLDSVFLIY